MNRDCWGRSQIYNHLMINATYSPWRSVMSHFLDLNSSLNILHRTPIKEIFHKMKTYKFALPCIQGNVLSCISSAWPYIVKLGACMSEAWLCKVVMHGHVLCYVSVTCEYHKDTTQVSWKIYSTILANWHSYQFHYKISIR